MIVIDGVTLIMKKQTKNLKTKVLIALREREMIRTGKRKEQ